MDFKFSKGSDDQMPMEGDAPKKKQSALLVLLLILLGGFSYIYFFTGLINPQPEQAPATPSAPQVVKKPLPPRDGEVPGAAPAETSKIAAAPSAPVPAAKPAAPATAAAPTVKPAPAAPAKAVVPAQPVVAKAPEKKEPVAPAKTEQKKAEPKPATGEQKPKGAVAKAVEKKTEETKKDGAEQKVKKTAALPKQSDGQIATAKQSEKGSWTVLVGSYLLEEALAKDLVAIRKAGLEANVQPGARKKTPMNRLQSAEFADRETAQQELAKIKKHTSDAFVIDNGGKFVVYAGSYLLDSRAASEKDRLASAGFKLSIKKVDVAIPTRMLTAGTYTSKKSAEEAVNKLKKAGLKATIK